MANSFQSELDRVGKADILIGIPSYNHSQTIAHAVQTIAAGIGQYFPAARTVLVNSDGGSTDGTQEAVKKLKIDNLEMVFLSHPLPPVDNRPAPYHGIPGKKKALRNFFEAAAYLRIKACVVFDPGLKSITREWVSFLLRPVLEEDFDYIAPLYARHPFEGTITNGIVYPLMRALYGKRIRQPLAPDFSLSGKLAGFCLEKRLGESETTRVLVDLWISTLAITGRYKIGQVYLGPWIHQAKEAGSDLGSIFTQVVSSVFHLMEEYWNFWEPIQESQPVPTLGRPPENLEPMSVKVEGMIAHFRLGVRALMEIWRKILPLESARELDSLGRLPDQAFFFSDDLWARLVYDFAVSFHEGLIHRDHLLKSMIPLYLGWVASLIKTHQKASSSEVEEKLESLCRVFEEKKAYLRRRWKAPGGGT